MRESNSFGLNLAGHIHRPELRVQTVCKDNQSANDSSRVKVRSTKAPVKTV